MAQIPFHNRSQFERAIEKMMDRALDEKRAGDLDRVVHNLAKAPEQVSELTSLLMLLDDDYRTELKGHIDAYRRFQTQKGRNEASDEDIVAILRDTYKRHTL